MESWGGGWIRQTLQELQMLSSFPSLGVCDCHHLAPMSSPKSNHNDIMLIHVNDKEMRRYIVGKIQLNHFLPALPI